MGLRSRRRPAMADGGARDGEAEPIVPGEIEPLASGEALASKVTLGVAVGGWHCFSGLFRSP